MNVITQSIQVTNELSVQLICRSKKISWDRSYENINRFVLHYTEKTNYSVCDAVAISNSHLSKT